MWPNPIFLLFFLYFALGPKMGSLPGRRGCNSICRMKVCCGFWGEVCDLLLNCFFVSKYERQQSTNASSDFCRSLLTPLFCASLSVFFSLSTPPLPRQFSSPKPLSGTSDPFFLVEKREPSAAWVLGRCLGPKWKQGLLKMAHQTKVS